MTEREKILLGALLHDIGKFWQRTEPDKKIKHQTWSVRFFEEFIPDQWKEAKEIVENNHESGHDKSAVIVKQADALSTGMDLQQCEDDEKEDITIERLSVILEKISIQKNEKKLFHYKYRLTSLCSDEKVFPFIEEKKENLVKEYNKLWNDFTKEILLLRQKEFINFFNTLYYLLQKYTWCIPVSTNAAEPDISLFNHLKTSAAISSCLHETKGEENFFLVEGDISGIQDFIYRMVTPQDAQEHMSKRLRGKSFYLSLMMETFAFYLLEKLDLTIVNLLWCGGGHFAVLAPGSEQKKNVISKFDEKVNTWLYHRFSGDLSMNVGVIETDGEGLKDFSNVLYEMSLTLSKLKNKKFQTVKESKIFPLGKGVCPVCGKDVDRSDRQICEQCKKCEEIGGFLPKLDTLVLMENYLTKEKGYVSFDDFGLCWALGKDKMVKGKDFTIFSLDPEQFIDNKEHAYGFKSIANEVMLENEKEKIPASFEKLAEASEGAEYLGILRMDVDNLGAVFSLGLGSNRSISRVTELSRTIDFFFCSVLNKICKELNAIYITYAGGDDVFIVGAWDKIVDLSRQINRSFNEYCAENPDLKLSAGIHVCKKKFPISRAAEIAGRRLEDSKTYRKQEKNAVTIFNHTVNWNTLDRVIHLGDYIIQNLATDKNKHGVISRRFIYQLLNLYKQHLEKEEQDLLWVPKLLYILARNLDIKNNQTAREVYSKLRNELAPMAEQIPILISYTAMKTRDLK